MVGHRPHHCKRRRTVRFGNSLVCLGGGDKAGPIA
jgi:hypothetical protein